MAAGRMMRLFVPRARIHLPRMETTAIITPLRRAGAATPRLELEPSFIARLSHHIHRWQWYGSCPVLGTSPRRLQEDDLQRNQPQPATEIERPRTDQRFWEGELAPSAVFLWHIQARKAPLEPSYSPVIVPLWFTKSSRDVGVSIPSEKGRIETEAGKGHAGPPACCMCCRLRLRALPRVYLGVSAYLLALRSPAWPIAALGSRFSMLRMAHPRH